MYEHITFINKFGSDYILGNKPVIYKTIYSKNDD